MRRYKIGIIFNFSPSWMGGIMYILNIVKILDFLDEKDKPEVFLFYKSDLKRFVNEIKYSYLNPIEWEFPSIYAGYIKSLFTRKNIFIEKILGEYSLNSIFPLQDFPVKTKTKVRLIPWNSDFQYKYYPEFFTKIQIIGRDIRTRFILQNSDELVLSSRASYKDLTSFFKVQENLNIHIYHFISVIDNQDNIGIDDLKVKYNLPDKYFLVSNQFHKHKNHKVLLLSLAKLKEMGIIKYIVMTGKLPDASVSPYLSELQEIIEDNKLHDQVRFLGVIPRNNQLQIMKHSQAVVQPSLFEGWSTVIEDAKSLQVPVVASNLVVNIEQLGEKGIYFDAHNSDELASILMNYPERDLNDRFYDEYPKRIKGAAAELMKIFRTS